MSLGIKQKNEILLKMKQIQAAEWILSFWFAVSVCFLIAYRYLSLDEILGRSEVIRLAILFSLTFFVSILLSVVFFRKNTCKGLLLFLSMFLGMAFVFILPSNKNRTVELIRDYQLKIIEMDEGAEVGLGWAYWADFPDRSDAEIMDYKHYQDISFSQFNQIGTWQVTEEGYLATTEKGAFLQFKNRGLHFHSPVLCIRSKNGRALVSESYNGKVQFYTLNGVDVDPLPTTGFRNSLIGKAIGKVLFGLSYGGIIALVLNLLVRLLKRPIEKILPYYTEISERKKWYQQSWFIVVASFLLPVFLMILLCVLIEIYPFGNKTFLRMDMRDQYADYLAYLRTMAANGNNLFYSFSKNLGGEMSSLAAYYLNNPINYLIYLFPLQDLPKAITLLIVLRIGLCGLTSNLFFRNTGKADFSTTIFSTSYAMMAYCMVNAENVFFIDGVIFLPLVALGIAKIIEKNSIVLYVVSLAAILMINFYMGFMICIFSVLFFFYRMLIRFDIHSLKNAKKQIFSFIMGSLLSAGLAAVVLIPVYFQIENSRKYVDVSRISDSIKFNIIDLFSKNFIGAYDLDEYKYGLPSIYAGVIITIFVILFFINKRIQLKEKWLSFGLICFFLISFQFQFLNLIWHGFSEPNWWPFRNSFIFSFILISIAWKSFLSIQSITTNEVVLGFIIFICINLFVGNFDYDYLSQKEIFLEIVFGSLIFILLFLLKSSDVKNSTVMNQKTAFLLNLVLLSSVCLNMTINAKIILSENISEALTVEEFNDQTVSTDKTITKIKNLDQSLFRTEKLYSRSKNDALRNNYYGVSHYSSITRQIDLNFLFKLGINQVFYFTQYGEGSTVFVDSLLGIKYILAKDDRIVKPYETLFTEEEIYVFKNPLALSFGFIVPNNMLGTINSSDNTFDFQNQIEHVLSNNQIEDIYTPAKVIIDNNYTFDQTVTWTIDIDRSDLLYANFFAEKPESIMVNQTSLMNLISENLNGVILLGKFAPGDQLIIKFRSSDIQKQLLSPQIYFENYESIEKLIQLLKNDNVCLEMISSSHLFGSYNSTNDNQYLLFSIPYDDAWKISVDGKPAQKINYLYNLMGIKISKGKHQIDMQYLPRGFYFGMIVSILSVIFFVIFLFIINMKNIGEKKRTG